tara:strand:- start:38 stop:328 length:291 start_codon:yes stop_codon:yes gene_type:complete
MMRETEIILADIKEAEETLKRKTRTGVKYRTDLSRIELKTLELELVDKECKTLAYELAFMPRNDSYFALLAQESILRIKRTNAKQKLLRAKAELYS